MATGGRLDALTIAAVFVVVFAGMYAGVELREGELLPPDTTTAEEDRLRTAVWGELDERRAARGLAPMPRDRFVRGVAQDTVEAVVARDPGGTGTPGATVDVAGLPNGRLFCSRTVVAVPAANGTATPGTAAAVADALAAAEGSEAIYRSPARFRAGMGIAVHGETVYAVYRSCEQVDT